MIAFYFLAPTRFVRILRSIPRWNMGHVARQFVSFLLQRDIAESLGRERLRRFGTEHLAGSLPPIDPDDLTEVEREAELAAREQASNRLIRWAMNI